MKHKTPDFKWIENVAGCFLRGSCMKSHLLKTMVLTWVYNHGNVSHGLYCLHWGWAFFFFHKVVGVKWGRPSWNLNWQKVTKFGFSACLSAISLLSKVKGSSSFYFKKHTNWGIKLAVLVLKSKCRTALNLFFLFF